MADEDKKLVDLPRGGHSLLTSPGTTFERCQSPSDKLEVEYREEKEQDADTYGTRRERCMRAYYETVSWSEAGRRESPQVTLRQA